MKFADRLKFTATGTSTSALTIGAAVASCRSLAQAIADGDLAVTDTNVPFMITDGTNWEASLFTIGGTDQAPTLTLVSVISSSAGGTTPATFSGPLTVFNTVPSDYLEGQSVASYLTANPAATLSGSDTVLGTQGNNAVGMLLSNIATFVLNLWEGRTEKQVPVTSATAFPLDFAAHNRKRLVCTAAVTSINAPSTYATVGDGFSCKVTNLSGVSIPLGSGMTVFPAGNTSIPTGGTADIFATGGSIYVELRNMGSGNGSGSATTETLTVNTPATQTAGTAFTVSGTYANGTPTALDWSIDGGSTWNAAASPSISGGTYSFGGVTVPSANASQTITVRDHSAQSITATSAAFTVNASSGGGGGSVTITATAPGISGPFPSVQKTFESPYCYQDITISGATIASINSGLSQSNTVPPTSSISMTDATPGHWFGAVTQYGANQNNYINNGTSGFSVDIQTPIDLYYWLIVTDSNGTVWNYVYPETIKYGSNVTDTNRATTMTAGLVSHT